VLVPQPNLLPMLLPADKSATTEFDVGDDCTTASANDGAALVMAVPCMH
jgi:hypothetical protein